MRLSSRPPTCLGALTRTSRSGGVHFNLGELTKDVRFRPTVEVGFGDDQTLVQMLAEVHFAQSLNIDEVLGQVVDQILNHLERVDRGAILLLNRERGILREVVSKTSSAFDKMRERADRIIQLATMASRGRSRSD